MIFAWYLEDSRKRLGESVDPAPNPFCDLSGMSEGGREASLSAHAHMLVD